MARSGSVSMSVKVDPGDIRRLDRALRQLGKDGKKATAAAIKKTLKASPKITVDIAKKDRGVTAPVKALKDAVRPKQVGGQSGKVVITAKPIGLEKFTHSPRVPQNPPPKRGLRVTVFRGAPTRRGSAFKNPDKGGNFRIFQRKTRRRYPIKKLFGPSTYTLLRYDKRNLDLLKLRLTQRLNKETASQVSRFLARKR